MQNDILKADEVPISRLTCNDLDIPWGQIGAKHHRRHNDLMYQYKYIYEHAFKSSVNCS